jgi:uncharacterized membrane protein SpoIIM required for sporulation
VIIDLDKFIRTERPHWSELERVIEKLEAEPELRMNLTDLTRFHYLYRRAAADLAKIVTFSSEPELRRYLESIVARAYGEIHESRQTSPRGVLRKWFFGVFPQTFRKHIRAFQLSLVITVVGCVFGGLAISLDPEAKAVLVPFDHLRGSPSERVAREETAATDRLQGAKTGFSATLMTHNTKVSIFTLALGMTWGIGTVITLFFNGVILGAISADYMLAGQSKFLVGWLLPHGAIEIPAILIAGQAGLLLASALIGWGNRLSLRQRFRQIGSDLMTLIFGVAILLIWAGIVEAFFSQYHEPILPYAVKIAFGTIELTLLFLFLTLAGRPRISGS